MVVRQITARGLKLVNADLTLIAQEPKLSPYFPEMLDNISRTLGIAPDCLNLKATTTEQMGFAGRGEGIAAHAVVSLTGNSASPQL
jgi:2-C-methyl-D-erythritol 2,4-cyclodiphosphate synthase